MQKIFLSLLVMGLSSIIFTGCATIFTQTQQRINFNSEPEGAKVIVNGLEMGRTPTTVNINKPGFGSTTVTLRLMGYEDKTFLLDKSFNVVSLLNFLTVLPWMVDAATGAFMNYSHAGYDFTLDKKAQAMLKK